LTGSSMLAAKTDILSKPNSKHVRAAHDVQTHNATGPNVASPGAATPEELRALATVMNTGHDEQVAGSQVMVNTQRTALWDKRTETKKSLKASEAQDAYVKASDASKVAQELTDEAAKLREAAALASQVAAEANKALEDKQQEEMFARVNASQLSKSERKKLVAFETKSMQVEMLQNAEVTADSETAAAKETKAAKDDTLYEALRVQTAVNEKLQRAEADRQEKNDALAAAKSAYNKAEIAASDAVTASEAADAELGVKEAELAKATVEEETAIKNRRLARNNYDQKQMSAHKLDEKATEAVSRAKAFQRTSDRMANDAKNQSNTVNLMP